MRVLITGAGGQLGRDLQRALAGHELRPCSHAELDIADATAVDSAIASFRPQVVVHAAALTDTGRCEREPEAAHEINATGAQRVAAACARHGAAMVYVSTNEVFDGEKPLPYLESDQATPINHYGRSKLAGERAVQAALAEHYIVRTAWLYGHGGNHFVAKMLRAAGEGKLTVVTDEIATPTWTHDLAAAIATLIETGRYGTYHFTNSGQASRFEWVQEILRLAGKTDVSLRPGNTYQFRAALPADAIVPEKPPFSVLANAAGGALGIVLRPWREALAAYFASGE
jgi:dTDP-4-dehydrorhamnose reductase